MSQTTKEPKNPVESKQKNSSFNNQTDKNEHSLTQVNNNKILEESTQMNESVSCPVDLSRKTQRNDTLGFSITD